MMKRNFKTKFKSSGLIFLLFIFVSTLFQPLVAQAVELNIPVDSLNTEIQNPAIDELESSDLPDLNNPDNSELQPHLISGEWENQFLSNEQQLDDTKVKDNLSMDLYSGSVTYKYDFNLPAGRNGLTPSIDLSYNSQNLQAESAYGYGWGIEGILSIQRNKSDGLDTLYTNNRFVFSGGGDLVPVALTDSVHGEYLLNIDNGDYLRFIYQGTDYWEIIDKQGLHYFLGATVESREGVSNGTAVWKLNKIQDKNGNFILFRYDFLNGVSWLSRITYTHWGTTNPLYEVRFFYSSRTNYQKSYQYGFLQLFNKKLNNVQVSVSGVPQQNYQFNIQENAGVLLLNSIVQQAYNQNTALWESLPASSFEYNLPVANNWQSQTLAPVSFSLDYYNGLELADINNDGYSDVLIANDLISSTNQISNERKTYLHNKSNGFSGDMANYHLPVPLFIKRANGYNFFTDYNLFDLNGDSYLDVAKNNSVYLFNKNTNAWNLNNNYRWFDHWFYKDNVAVEIGANHDFNGDGLPDYAHLKNQNVYLNKWTSTQNNLVYGWTSLPSALLDSSYKLQGVRLLDLNGDGLTDILRSKYYIPTNAWSRFVYLNKGNGQWIQETTDFVSPLAFCRQSTLIGDCVDNKVLFIDVNQDGLADLLDSDGKFYLNNGHGWLSTSAGQWNLPFSLLSGSEWSKFRFAEADGLPGLDLWKSDGQTGSLYNLAWYKNPSPYVYLLNKIKNEKGAQIFIEYESSSRYNNNTGSPFSVLKKVSVDDGLGQRLLEEYNYQGVQYYFDSIWQRWRSGFGLISKTLSNGRVERYYFHQGNGDNYPFETNDDVSKRGKLFYWEILDNTQPLRGNLSVWDKQIGRPNQNLILETYDWIFYFGANYPTPAQSILLSKVYDLQTGNLSSSTDWGLVTYQSPRQFQDLDATDNRQEVFTYALDKSNEIRSSVSSRKILNHSNQVLLHEKFAYDALADGLVSKGLMTKHSLLGNNNLWIAENFIYNGYGLNTKYTDFSGNAYNYVYEAQNYYPAQTTNPLGHLQQSVYNYACGLPSQETDLNGVISVYRYDGFCRPVEIKRQTGTLTEILQQWQYVDSSFPMSVTQKDYANAQTYDESKTYFDGLGRAILRLKKQANGNWAGILSQYDNNGFLARQSLPFDSNSGNWQVYQANLWENYTYDVLYRLTAWNNGRENFNINYQDFDRRSLSLNNQFWGEYQFDSRDNLRSVRLNNGQNYVYQFDILGRLTKLTDSQGNFRQLTYDLLGQPIAIDDWHAPGDSTFGRWQYLWDANGNLLEKQIPGNQKIIYRYDRLNRLLQEDDSGTSILDWQYLYDGGSFGKGNLTGLKNQDLAITYQYDWRGFLAGETYLLKGQAYTYQYARNYVGQSTYIVYPDQSALEYRYNSQGFLNKATYYNVGNSKAIVAGRQYNHFGAVTEELLGNSTQRTFRYDDYGTVLGEAVLGNGQTLWSQEYTYDSWKNLSTLLAGGTLIPNYQANFSYDASHRLSSYNFIGANSQSLASGNYTYNDLNGFIGAKNKNYQYETTLSSMVNPYAPIASTGTGINWQADYDAVGNITDLGPYQLTWDANQRLRTVNYNNGQTAKTYFYSPDGQRLMAERANGSKQIWLDNYYADDATGIKEFSYASLLRQVSPQTEKFTYQYYDKFNNLALSLTETAQLENYYIYEPDGKIIQQYQNQDKDSGSFYHQQWRDSGEENLDYKGDRYYSADWQHYLSADPVHLDFPLLSWEEQQQVLVNPVRLNPYIYLAHNPYQNTDTSNAFWETVWDVISLGLSIKDLIVEPSWKNAAFVGMDIVSMFTPFLPSSSQLLKKSGKLFLAGGEVTKLSVKYQNEIKKAATYLNKSAEDVWKLIKTTASKIDSKLGKKINKYWRGGHFDDVQINFAEHYVKHGGELSKFGIKSMDDYLNYSSKFIGVSDNMLVNELGTFHRIIDYNGDVMFFNPHNNLLTILGKDKAGEYIKSMYEVTGSFRIKNLFSRIISRAGFWLFDFLSNWRLDLGQILMFPKPLDGLAY